MYRVYLYNREDHYLAPVYYDDLDEALNQVLPFVQNVPRILVLNDGDHTVFESKLGRIIYPEKALDDLLNATRQYNLDGSKLYHTVEMINKMHHLVLCLLRAGAPDKQALQLEINRLDLFIQGFAAATYNNVCHLGYCNPDMMMEELSVNDLRYSA